MPTCARYAFNYMLINCSLQLSIFEVGVFPLFCFWQAKRAGTANASQVQYAAQEAIIGNVINKKKEQATWLFLRTCSPMDTLPSLLLVAGVLKTPGL